MIEQFGKSANICIYFLAVFLIAQLHAGAADQPKNQ